MSRWRLDRATGAVLKIGLDAAQRDWVLITDADNTYPGDAIVSLFNAALDNETVAGSRTGPVVKDSLLRRPVKWFLYILAGYFVGEQFLDLNSGLCLMGKDPVKQYLHLLPSVFSLTTTIMMSAACNDHKVQ